MPKRGSAALALTALALVLLLNFQAPSGIDTARGSSGTGSTGAGTGSAGTGTSGTGFGSSGSGSGSGGGTTGPAGGGSVSGGTGSSGGGSGGTTGPAGSSGGGSGDTSTGMQTVTGPTVNTRFGPVQVSVTVNGSTITDVTALQLPDGDRRSSSISSRVEPTLRTQSLRAQSANIDGVSGATYTSIAYARSLQAALDSAGV